MVKLRSLVIVPAAIYLIIFFQNGDCRLSYSGDTQNMIVGQQIDVYYTMFFPISESNIYYIAIGRGGIGINPDFFAAYTSGYLTAGNYYIQTKDTFTPIYAFDYGMPVYAAISYFDANNNPISQRCDMTLPMKANYNYKYYLPTTVR